MPYKLYELIDINRGHLYQDFTNGEEIRKSMWGLQPINDLYDSDDHEINEEFVSLVENRDNFIIRKPIFSMFALSEEFKKAFKNINGYISKSKNPSKFYDNMIDLQESLKKHGFYEGDDLIIDESEEISDKSQITEGKKFDDEKTQEIYKILDNRFKFQQLNYLGSGNFGDAYDVGNNMVLKITKDNSEAIENLDLLHKDLRLIAKPYGVFKLTSKSTEDVLYAIVLEKLKTDHDDTRRKIERLKYIFSDIFGLDFYNVLDGLVVGGRYNEYEDHKEKIDKYFNSNVEDKKFFIGLVNIAREVKRLGVESYDFINPDNLGYNKNGELSFFDLGFGNPYKTPTNQPVSYGISENELFTENVQQMEKNFVKTNMFNDEDVQNVLSITNGDNYTNMVAGIYAAYMSISSENRDRVDSSKFKSTRYDTYLNGMYDELKNYNKNVFPIKNMNTLDPLSLQDFIDKRRRAIKILKTIPSVYLRNLKNDIRRERDVQYELEYGLPSTMKSIKSSLEQIKDMSEDKQGKLLQKVFSSKNDTLEKVDDQLLKAEKLYLSHGDGIDELRELVGYTDVSEAKILYDSNNVIVVDIKSSDAMKELGCGSQWCFTTEYSDEMWNDYAQNSHVNIVYNFNLDKDEYNRMVVVLPDGEVFNMYNEQMEDGLNYLSDLGVDQYVNLFHEEPELSEDRQKSYMPQSKEVSVKKKCRLGGLGNTSAACNQGDINNLEFSSINEVVANSQEDVDRFISDSKVKETVYHGSPVGGLEDIGLRKGATISSGLKEEGIYFTSNEKLAQEYRKGRKLSPEFEQQVKLDIRKLEKERENVRNNRDWDRIELEIKKLESKLGGEVYGVKLKIRNPLIFDAKGKDGYEGWDELVIDLGYKAARGKEAVNMIGEKNPVAKDYHKYDGIIAKNMDDRHAQADSDYIGDVYAVFDERQILILNPELTNAAEPVNEEDVQSRENVVLDSDFKPGWNSYNILHGDEIAGEIEVTDRDKYMTLNKIEIKKEHRGMGHADVAIKILLNYANNQNKIVTLTPDNIWGASKDKLKRWYKSLGFILNSGKNKDFQTRELMYKLPDGQKLTEVTENSGGYMVFHGSDTKVDNFTNEFIGGSEATDQEGPGIYFTSNHDDALPYGNYIHTVRLSPRKLVDESSLEDVSEDEMYNLIKMSPDWETGASNWSEDPESGVYEAISSMKQYSDNEKDLFQQIWYDFFRYYAKEFAQGMVKLGYDGQIIDKPNNIKHFIIYNPDIIEIKDIEIINNDVNEMINEESIKLGENKGIMELQDLPFKQDVYDLGGKIYSVGGAVRDEFIGKKSKDLDILVTGIPMEQLSQIMSKYGKVDAVGKSFGILKFTPPEGEEVDVALPRTEVATGEGGHKGFDVKSDHTLPLKVDLKRRDFTINAIAKDISGNVIDPYSGMQDIQNKIIRVVNPEAFSDDPLRMLRAVQFAARFDFTIEPKTLKMIRDNAARIKEIPTERVLIELEKIVSKGDPSIGAFNLKNTRLFESIFGKDAPLYAGPNWKEVKTMAEFMYLLTSHVLESPSEFFKTQLRGDINTVKELRGLELGMADDSTDVVKNRSTAFNVNRVSPRALSSGLLPRTVKRAAQEFATGRYPKTINELDIDGNDLKRFGLEGAEIGNTLKSLLINVYADKVKNNKQDLINMLGYIPSENLNEGSKTNYTKTKESVKRSKSLSKEMKEKISEFLNSGSKYNVGGTVTGLTKPKISGKSFKGNGLGADKKGFFVYTHRAASKRYESPDKIPQKDIDFIETTG